MKPLILYILFAIALSSCKHHATEPVDGITSATVPHNKIILPPTNSQYRVVGHLEGLNNYVVQYSDVFYRGGQTYAEDLATESLKRLNIKTVVSIVPDDAERAFCTANGFALVEIPFDKTGPKPDDYRRYFQTLEKGEGPFYIHCKGGSHRAGILGAAYRMKFQDWPVEKALVEYGRLGGDLKTDHAMTATLQTLSTK